MAVAAIRPFKPPRLSPVSRQVGTAWAPRPPEAPYQDEFYHALHDITEGCFLATPEFRSAARASLGRIDFFVPQTGWGVEITQEGDRLAEHGSQFEAPRAWLGYEMKDYILLDFRTSAPSEPYQGFNNLYRVVFEVGFGSLRIYNHKLEAQGNAIELVED
ncbi:hypothetical protein BOTBODRAFT_512617 [Botryobasidium botryosum FD-172 SS1]|uniref:Uncharacterized protein n=1 Tax=Botryobasidium botryosum (strain FD-172 SS1) TaxID=930990 RepID=A0A067MRV3_BOTB1|nr:hypothetical protein BOTBODRAFT_512617 [Botryobasidium botryosum FD-172 SS1]